MNFTLFFYRVSRIKKKESIFKKTELHEIYSSIKASWVNIFQHYLWGEFLQYSFYDKSIMHDMFPDSYHFQKGGTKKGIRYRHILFITLEYILFSLEILHHVFSWNSVHSEK